jgi:hypothetical protein
MTRGFLNRVRNRVRLLLVALPDRYYSRRHPGPVARRVISLLGPLVRFIGPNDKWNLHVFAREWIRVLDVPPIEPLPAPRRLFLFTAYRIQFTHDLTLAVLLAWRGHRVTVGYLPKLQSPVKEPLIDHPSAKPYLKAALGDIERLTDGRIRCIDLSDDVDGSVPVDEEFVESQCHADVVMHLARETLDPSDPAASRALAYYSALGRTSQRIAWTHLSRHKGDYDLCLIPNGTTYETAHFCEVAKRLGLPVNGLEKFAFRYTRVINHGDHFLAFNDLDAIWNRRHEIGFDREPFRRWACERAHQLLWERRDSSGNNWGWRLQRGKEARTTEETLEAVGIGSEERFVLICPNIPFDAGYSGLLTIFPSMKEWLVETVRWLLKETDLKLVVRAHPGEARRGQRQRTDRTLAEAGLTSERLIVVPAESPINTYPLMQSCHFGVVFSSTTGIEMAMQAKTVIPAADIYYKRRGFTVDAEDRDDYFAKLRRLGETGESLELSPQTADDAAMLYFIGHFVTQWPYPYDKPSSVHSLPPATLVTLPSVQKYLPTFDALALPVHEWREQLPKFVNDETIRARLDAE